MLVGCILRPAYVNECISYQMPSKMPRDHEIRTAALHLRTAYPMVLEHSGVLSHAASKSLTNMNRSNSRAARPRQHHPSNEKNGHGGAYCYLAVQHYARPTSHHKPGGQSV